jgi:hypothetical protein
VPTYNGNGEWTLPDIGVYASGGFGPGGNIGAGWALGLVKGDEKDISGITTNVNGGIAPVGGTVAFDANGDPVGFTIGEALQLGGSVTHADTGAYGLRDFFDWLSRKFDKRCP